MKSLIKSLIAVVITIATIQANAGETPVFVSCYADDGSHLMLIFDTAQKQFTYRAAQGESVDTFDTGPSAWGYNMSSVTKEISADQNHIVLKAQTVGGDPIQPLIDTSVQVQFDRTDAGLQITSYSFYHLSQPINLDTFQNGICYVQ